MRTGEVNLEIEAALGRLREALVAGECTREVRGEIDALRGRAEAAAAEEAELAAAEAGRVAALIHARAEEIATIAHARFNRLVEQLQPPPAPTGGR